MALPISRHLRHHLEELGFEIKQEPRDWEVCVSLHNNSYVDDYFPVGWTIGDPGGTPGDWRVLGLAPHRPDEGGQWIGDCDSLEKALVAIVGWADTQRETWVRHR
ncbi:hypothetical protein ACGFZS_32465 [Streptomyces sp. NPDC048288]|uniref:hypothetical protein n=1 Tax=Streptomyces sp. NPDC048288 TaxID=3365529 RepID=UPI00372437F0